MIFTKYYKRIFQRTSARWASGPLFETKDSPWIYTRIHSVLRLGL